jgi:hypothetical protein
MGLLMLSFLCCRISSKKRFDHILTIIKKRLPPSALIFCPKVVVVPEYHSLPDGYMNNHFNAFIPGNLAHSAARISRVATKPYFYTVVYLY